MTDWTLDDADLESYINGFYGHGRYDAKYWFVGMEFGGGGSVKEIVSRIEGWHDRGGQELEDLGPGGVGAQESWFLPPYPLQRTWKQIIRVLLTAEGKPHSREDLRTYQKERLGRKAGLECIVELLPLPSPRSNDWLFYHKYSKLPYLQDRAIYRKHVEPARTAHLRRMIEKYRPGVVVFYGTTYEQSWQKIACVDFKPTNIAKVSAASNGQTLFVSMQHPTARGLKDTYFEVVGRFIASVARN